MRRADRRTTALAGAALLALAQLSATAAPPLPAEFDTVLPLLQPARRGQLQQRAATWASWTAAERARFAERAADWDATPAAQRGARRERYLAWQALPAAERTRVTLAVAAHAALPAAQQQALRAQFDALDGSTRRGWLLGPALGADYPALQPLLAQVPPGEHAPLLRALRAMTPQQRADLAMLVQRTPPHERATLRRELQSTSAANREAWLWQRLDR
ncbi:DUF3106 domain-containing protein [Lysobacter koreensis]|uniref:DUF3106 domain-containing protein n=1 Tax=Lysobacter koreensis TaxID=266122 RepID=A0ABW2YK57_9GAMM